MRVRMRLSHGETDQIVHTIHLHGIGSILLRMSGLNQPFNVFPELDNCTSPHALSGKTMDRGGRFASAHRTIHE